MKILFVATVVKKHIMEFHIPYLEFFKSNKWETAVAARNDYENAEECKIPFCDSYYELPFERFPFHFNNIIAYRKLKKIIDTEEFDIVHCHTPVGAMIGRLACIRARKKGTKVIYTAHGFHFFKGASLTNWLFFYPIERLAARFTDLLITINQEDYNRAKKFKAKEIVYVPGVGIDLQKFSADKKERKTKRQELGIRDDDIVFLSVGELIPRKNHEIVLRAIAELKDNVNYKHIHYVICGSGILYDQLVKLTCELGIKEKVSFLGYRNDIAEICNVSDVFVFMSKQEGLPVALMEAMACGLPVVCSNVRGNTDLVKNGVNGYVVDINLNDLVQCLSTICSNDNGLPTLAINALQSIKKYDILEVKEEMRIIYEHVSGKKLV